MTAAVFNKILGFASVNDANVCMLFVVHKIKIRCIFVQNHEPTYINIFIWLIC